jgi:hypothetical protein
MKRFLNAIALITMLTVASSYACNNNDWQLVKYAAKGLGATQSGLTLVFNTAKKNPLETSLITFVTFGALFCIKKDYDFTKARLEKIFDNVKDLSADEQTILKHLSLSPNNVWSAANCSHKCIGLCYTHHMTKKDLTFNNGRQLCDEWYQGNRNFQKYYDKNLKFIENLMPKLHGIDKCFSFWIKRFKDSKIKENKSKEFLITNIFNDQTKEMYIEWSTSCKHTESKTNYSSCTTNKQKTEIDTQPIILGPPVKKQNVAASNKLQNKNVSSSKPKLFSLHALKKKYFNLTEETLKKKKESLKKEYSNTNNIDFIIDLYCTVLSERIRCEIHNKAKNLNSSSKNNNEKEIVLNAIIFNNLKKANFNLFLKHFNQTDKDLSEQNNNFNDNKSHILSRKRIIETLMRSFIDNQLSEKIS